MSQVKSSQSFNHLDAYPPTQGVIQYDQLRQKYGEYGLETDARDPRSKGDLKTEYEQYAQALNQATETYQNRGQLTNSQEVSRYLGALVHTLEIYNSSNAGTLGSVGEYLPFAGAISKAFQVYADRHQLSGEQEFAGYANAAYQALRGALAGDKESMAAVGEYLPFASAALGAYSTFANRERLSTTEEIVGYANALTQGLGDYMASSGNSLGAVGQALPYTQPILSALGTYANRDQLTDGQEIVGYAQAGYQALQASGVVGATSIPYVGMALGAVAGLSGKGSGEERALAAQRQAAIAATGWFAPLVAAADAGLRRWSWSKGFMGKLDKFAMKFNPHIRIVGKLLGSHDKDDKVRRAYQKFFEKNGVLQRNEANRPELLLADGSKFDMYPSRTMDELGEKDRKIYKINESDPLHVYSRGFMIPLMTILNSGKKSQGSNHYGNMFTNAILSNASGDLNKVRDNARDIYAKFQLSPEMALGKLEELRAAEKISNDEFSAYGNALIQVFVTERVSIPDDFAASLQAGLSQK